MSDKLFIPKKFRPDVTAKIGDVTDDSGDASIRNIPYVIPPPGVLMSGCKEGTSDGSEGSSEGKEDAGRELDLEFVLDPAARARLDLASRFKPTLRAYVGRPIR